MKDQKFGTDRFDEEFARTRKTAGKIIIANAIIAIGVIGFFGWVIVKVMQHFSII